jgi:hypothetical protein
MTDFDFEVNHSSRSNQKLVFDWSRNVQNFKTQPTLFPHFQVGYLLDPCLEWHDFQPYHQL